MLRNQYKIRLHSVEKYLHISTSISVDQSFNLLYICIWVKDKIGPEKNVKLIA